MKETLHLYLRVSTSIQETEGTSLKTQEETGIELSKQLGMNYEIHNEGGSSSNFDTLDNRPVMLNLLRLMDDGVVKNLYVWNTDRISRNQITFFTIRQKMIQNGVILYTSGGRYNSENYMENMILGILSEVSQYDNKVRTERSRLGKIERVKQNYWRGGDTSFGYTLISDGIGNRLVEEKTESKWVKFIYNEYSNGTSLKEIKSILDNNNVKTRRGKEKWSLGSLQKILLNDTYIGVDTFIDKKTNLTITNSVPQIIDNELWEEVQKRRIQILERKNQFKKSKNFYLFRDFMVCNCGTPMGGRTYPKKYVRHYYCPLSERNFNKSEKTNEKCRMKRCLNIPTTDNVLWNHIIDILSDSITLKEKMTELGLFGVGKSYEEIISHKNSISEEIENHKQKLKKIERGLVDTETKRVLNEFESEEIYKGIKKNLTKQYKIIQLKIEDLKTHLQQIGEEKSWFEWVEKFGDDIKSKRDISDIQKKEVLKLVIQKIVVDYDHNKKVHNLTLNFKIPVMVGDEGSSKTTRIVVEPPKSGRKVKINSPLISNYSTVTLLARFLG